MMRRTLLGLALCTILAPAAAGCGGGDCGDVVFPAAAGVGAGAGAVYVSVDCPADGADGTKEHPFATIQQGIDAAPSGGAVLVAPGTYAENLRIDKTLSVLGSDAEALPDDSKVTLAAPAPNAITVAKGAANVLIRGIVVRDAVAVGVRVDEGASATLERSRVEDTKPAPDGTAGFGVLAVNDGSIIICLTRIARSALVGVLVSGGKAEVREAEIRENGQSTSEPLQAGILVERASGPVWIHDSTIADSAVVGIAARSSEVRLTANVITGSRTVGGAFGDGLLAAPLESDDGALTTLTVEAGNMIVKHARVGVLLSGGARGSITGSEISDNGGAGTFAAGIWAQAGAGGPSGLAISGNTVARNHYVGVGLTTAARATIDGGNVIRDTVLDTAFAAGMAATQVGDGVGLYESAYAVVKGNTIQNSARFGVMVSAADSNSVVDKNVILQSGQFDAVVQLEDQGAVLGQSNELGSTKVVGPMEMPFAVVAWELTTP